MNRVFNDFGQDINKNKVAASLYLTLPGIPYLYYGEEVGMLGQKPDEDIRLPMQWNDEANAGFTTGNPWRAPNSNFRDFNVEGMLEDENSLFNHYRELIQLRNKYSDIQVSHFEIGASNYNESLGFLRMDPVSGNGIFVISNLSDRNLESISIEFSDVLMNNYSNHFWAIESGNLLNGSIDEFDIVTDVETGTNVFQNINLTAYETGIFNITQWATSSENQESPIAYKLNQNYPNPFNPNTVISYQLAENSNVTLKVFDVTGREVAVLENGFRNAGNHTVNFDASTLSSGIYFYRLEAGDFVETRKMMLIK